MKTKIKIFDCAPDRDILTVTRAYGAIAEALGLCEWNPVVWLGRLFLMDNDLGEHWFDNWELREARGAGFEEALIVDPARFQDGRDGPCHSDEFRKRFWTDVLCSLELSLDVLFDQARLFQKEIQAAIDEAPNHMDVKADRIPDLEDRIGGIRKQYGCTTSR